MGEGDKYPDTGTLEGVWKDNEGLMCTLQDGEDETYAASESCRVYLSRTAGSRPANVNAVVTAPEPVVDPPVATFCQFSKAWAKEFIFPDTKSEGCTWKKSGCCATCMAMVMRWWAEHNPETKGQVLFPYALKGKKPPTGKIKSPLQVNQWLRNNRWVSEVYGPNAKGEQVRKFKIDYSGLFASARRVKWRKSDSETLTMKHKVARFQGKNPPDRQAAIKDMLQLGPVMANMNSPGHYVVIQGYRGKTIYICDPGKILLQKEPGWGPNNVAKAQRVSPDATRDEEKECTCSLQDDFIFPQKQSTWVATILRLDVLYFDGNNKHPAWNRTQV